MVIFWNQVGLPISPLSFLLKMVIVHNSENAYQSVQHGAPKIAFSWLITHWDLWTYGRHIELVNGILNQLTSLWFMVDISIYA